LWFDLKVDEQAGGLVHLLLKGFSKVFVIAFGATTSFLRCVM